MGTELLRQYMRAVREMKLFFETASWPPEVDGRKIIFRSGQGDIPENILDLIGLVKGDGTLVNKTVTKQGKKIMIVIDPKERVNHVRLTGPWIKDAIDQRVIPLFLGS